jgi:hypothetical protein
MRLCHSRKIFVRAYPRETRERVFDARDRAFVFFKSACVRGVYNNMETAVEAILVGKDWQSVTDRVEMATNFAKVATARFGAVDPNFVHFSAARRAWRPRVYGKPWPTHVLVSWRGLCSW